VNPLAAVAKAIFGEYEIYRIYGRALLPDDAGANPPAGIRLDPLVDGSQVGRAEDPAIRRLASCAGDGAHGFGAWAADALVAVCWFWVGERYAKRNFWPLAAGEAKLVEIMSADAFRGRGIAGALLRYSCRAMSARGFTAAYARVWHSNAPSIRLFETDGWRHVATVAHLHPLGRKRPIRIVRRVRAARR
jgi:ribosomal protein S18 acetylase RimI-like enzyme